MLSRAVILVGGPGTRLKPLTNTLPKSMVPVLNNRPFLEHTIAYLGKYGVGDVVLTLNYLPDVIKSHLGNGESRGVKLVYAVEDSPLGTAGAIKNAEVHMDGTFAVLNGDIFTDIDLDDMLACHRRNKAQATIALTWADNPCAFGTVETGDGGRVKRFVEKPSPENVTSHWINAGIYILEPEVLRHIPQGRHYMFERGLFPALIEMGIPVYGYPFRGYWLDMGTPEKYLSLNCDLLRDEVLSPLTGEMSRNGVSCGADTVIHPSSVVMGPVVIGCGCRIEAGAFIRGPVVIGDGCRVGEGATIERAVLWDGVGVEAQVELKGCVVSRRREGGEQITACGGD